MSIPTLDSYLYGLRKIESPDYFSALKTVVADKTDKTAGVFYTTKEFFIKPYEVSGEYYFYDLVLNKEADIISNIKFENVHHYEFKSFKHFPEEICVKSMPYEDIIFRLFFKSVPPSFKIRYKCTLLPRSVYSVMDSVQTLHHVYEGGHIREKSV
jgi:hypothetical protein